MSQIYIYIYMKYYNFFPLTKRTRKKMTDKT